jgi:peptidoglycan/xylan/chitin deacetylase (PgdA/CDA1 family)
LTIIAVLSTLLKIGLVNDRALEDNSDDSIPAIGNPSITPDPTTGADTTPKKRVAITLDDGPHNVYTKLIVDELNKYGAHATFFVVGNRVDGKAYNGKSALAYAIASGNEIGIHGYTHERYYDKCSDADYEAELSKTLATIKSVSPDTPVTLMRPVGGKITNARVESCDYSVIMWSVDTRDWEYKYKTPIDEAVRQEKLDTIVNNAMRGVEDGSIILLHDIYESTYDALVIILERLYAEGYEVVTVSELLGDGMVAGQKYYSAG